MWTEFVLITFGILVGIAVCLLCVLCYDKFKRDEGERIVCDATEWCEKYCKLYEECFSQREDPDDAIKELDKHCCQCPVSEAQTIIFEEREKP